MHIFSMDADRILFKLSPMCNVLHVHFISQLGCVIDLSLPSHVLNNTFGRLGLCVNNSCTEDA